MSKPGSKPTPSADRVALLLFILTAAGVAAANVMLLGCASDYFEEPMFLKITADKDRALADGQDAIALRVEWDGISLQDDVIYVFPAAYTVSVSGPAAEGVSVSPTSLTFDERNDVRTVTVHGTKAGDVRVSITDQLGFERGAEIDLTFLGPAKPASKLAFTGAPDDGVAGVAPGSVTVAVQDADGAVVADSTATVTIALAGDTALNGTKSVAAVAGVATFADLTITKAGAGYTLSASSDGLTGATSAPFEVAPAGAASLAFVGLPATMEVGASQTLQVVAKDDFGNDATGYTSVVRLTADDTGATLPEPVQFEEGVGTFAAVVFRTPGARVLRVMDTATPAIAAEGAVTVVCASGLDECSAECVDLETSPIHCGACDTSCEEWEECSDGGCVASCFEFEQRCAGQCTDTRNDPAHCGTCATVCNDSDPDTTDLCVESACFYVDRPPYTEIRGNAFGGSEYIDECPVHQVVVGLNAEIGGSFDRIQVVCGTPRAPMGAGGITIDPGDTLALRGANANTPAQLRCPADTAVIGFGGRAGGLIDQLTLRCSALEVGVDGLAPTGVVTETDPVGGTGGTAFDDTDCPAGKLAIGGYIRAGGSVDGFGLICGNTGFAPPAP